MPSTMRIKLHINKTPLTNNRAPELRSILHKTLSEFSGGSKKKKLQTKQTYRKAENSVGWCGGGGVGGVERRIARHLVHANLTHKFDLYPSLKRR